MYQYAVLTRETTKDWVKNTQVNSVCATLEQAIENVNSAIESYIKDYELEEDFNNTFPTVSIKDIDQREISYGEAVQVINLKSPKDESRDPNDDGTWGNLRIYIQRIKKTC
jgi:predicted RNase H-like HicB family nuclease